MRQGPPARWAGSASRQAGRVVASGGVGVASARVRCRTRQGRRRVSQGGLSRRAGPMSCQAGAALCQAGSAGASGRAGRRARRGPRRVSQGGPSRQAGSVSRQPGRDIAPGRVDVAWGRQGEHYWQHGAPGGKTLLAARGPGSKGSLRGTKTGITRTPGEETTLALQGRPGENVIGNTRPPRGTRQAGSRVVSGTASVSCCVGHLGRLIGLILGGGRG